MSLENEDKLLINDLVASILTLAFVSAEAANWNIDVIGVFDEFRQKVKKKIIPS